MGNQRDGSAQGSGRVGKWAAQDPSTPAAAPQSIPGNTILVGTWVGEPSISDVVDGDFETLHDGEKTKLQAVGGGGRPSSSENRWRHWVTPALDMGCAGQTLGCTNGKVPTGSDYTAVAYDHCCTVPV